MGNWAGDSLCHQMLSVWQRHNKHINTKEIHLVEEDMTLGSFIIVGTAAIPQFVIWFVIFSEFAGSICFFSTLALTLCVDALGIF